MAADRIWQFYPVASGRPDTEHDSVWVERVRPIAVASRTRQAAYAVSHGSVLRVAVRDALIRQTVRIRYREDIDVDSFLLDPEGNAHNVDGFEEVGRRAFLDVAVTRYGLVAPPVAPADFTPPTGWTYLLDGRPVQQLVVDRILINDFARRIGFVARGQTEWTTSADPGSGPWAAEFEDGVDTMLSVVAGGFTVTPSARLNALRIGSIITVTSA